MNHSTPPTWRVVATGLASILPLLVFGLFILESTVMRWLNPEFIRTLFIICWLSGSGALIGHAWRASNVSSGWWTVLIIGSIFPLLTPFVLPAFWYGCIFKPSRSGSRYDGFEEDL